MSTRYRHIEVRHAGLGVTALWEGGVTVVLRDDASHHVLSRVPVGDGASAADVEVALRAIIDGERERRQASTLVDRARSAVQRGWALSGAANALLARSRSLAQWRSRRRWTELEPEAPRHESA